MAEMNLDTSGLTDEQIEVLKMLINLFKTQGQTAVAEEREEINFATWPLGVRGKLTREEIYDFI